MGRPDDDTIEARLRRALDVPLDAIHDGVDMSPAAVTRRLRDACDMSTLCLALPRAADRRGTD